MIGTDKIIAVITARGGSKRLPGKNILPLSGKPMIAWSIKAGLESKYVDRLIVSTDDAEIAAVAKTNGADVPFMRPEHLASSTASSIDAVIHAIDTLETQEDSYTYVLLLQPTSPLRTSEHIDQAVELLIKTKADSIIGVTEIDHPIEWTNKLPDDLSMDNFLSPQFQGIRSQDFPTRYIINGAIYLCRIDRLKEAGSFLLPKNTYAYIMDKSSAIDIDDDLNFQLAELFLNKKTNDSTDD